MKIAIVAVSAEDVYKSRREFMCGLLDLGHELLVLTPDSWDATKFFLCGAVQMRTIFMQRTGSNPLSDRKTYRDCKRIFREEKPDMVYAFSGAKAVIYGLMAKPKGCKGYCTINGLGSVFRSEGGLKNRLVRLVMEMLYTMALKKSDGVMFQNCDDLEVFVNKRLLSREKTSIINGSGVNLDKFALTPMPNKASFLFVGRLLFDKGIAEFIAAAKATKEKYPQAQFSVVGPLDSNPTAIKIEDMDECSNVVEYHGKRDDVDRFYRECSVFVLPSYHEGTPRTVLEAMATGRAIITTDAPGCRETVKDGDNGFLIPVGDSKTLEEKMLWCIEHGDEVKRMGQRSRTIAEEKYDVNKVNAQMRRIMGV
ncbi:MAG: glycosyltransferase family 4 protein [Eubacteriales bacterium]|nr:glycosyltransferase family 4 protein [Eubacteriales bacterium]